MRVPLPALSSAGIRWAALGITLLLAQSALAQVDVDTAAREQKKGAEKTFRAGSELFDDGRYEEAITAFAASDKIVASPHSRLMIARSLVHLGRLEEAREAYLETIALAESKPDRYRRAVEAARGELAEVEKRFASLKVVVRGASPDVRVDIDGRQFTQDTLAEPILLLPGTVTVTARSADGREVSDRADLEPGHQVVVELKFETKKIERRLSPREVAPIVPRESEAWSPSPLRTAAYVAGGVGVAGFVGFAVFGLLNNAKYSELESNCPDNRCSPDQRDAIDTGRTFQALANIGLVVGVMGLGAGGTLYLLTQGEQKERPPVAVSIGIERVRVEGCF